MLPDDDAGLDDIFVIANHLAHLAEPDQRIRAWLRRWAPWHGEDRTVALIRAVTSTPLKWRADVLARRLGLDYATRMRLRITTIGAIDCGKVKRAALRRKRNNAAKRASRAKGGAASHATSAARTEPWRALGISPRTYYRKRLNGTGGTNSGTACPKDIVVDAKQCHDANAQLPTPAAETVPHAPKGAREAPATGRQHPPDCPATSKDGPLIAVPADNQQRPFIVAGFGRGCDTPTFDTWLALRKRGKLCRSWQWRFCAHDGGRDEIGAARTYCSRMVRYPAAWPCLPTLALIREFLSRCRPAPVMASSPDPRRSDRRVLAGQRTLAHCKVPQGARSQARCREAEAVMTYAGSDVRGSNMVETGASFDPTMRFAEAGRAADAINRSGVSFTATATRTHHAAHDGGSAEDG